MKDLYTLKNDLWSMILKNLQEQTTKLWSLVELEEVLKSLKNNKSRDPNGLINEIFKSGVMGTEMKLALLQLFNQIKRYQLVPTSFKYANITSLYKNKGSRQLLDNDRGIFIVSTVRMILDSLVYKEKFNLIDKNMSVSNIGARSSRNIRDHLYVVYAIMNSVLNGDDAPIDIQIYDVEKCFDKLWLEDAMLDLVDTLPAEARDDRIALVYKLNEDNLIAVKTPFGLSERFMVKNVVMQGGKWGPLQCSNSIDKIGRKCIRQGQDLYKYRKEVCVPPLAMIDDLLVVAKCGIESVSANAVINKEIEMKNLRLHTGNNTKESKCHRIHVGKLKEHCRRLVVHGSPMVDVMNDSYLGDVISSDGKVNLTVENRVSRGIGIVSQIFDILKEVNFGQFFFEVALTLRESFLINGMLFNSEVWHGLTRANIEKLEEIDILFFRKLFNVPFSCPREAFYLETGCLPFNFIIKSRRLNYFHHLATRSRNEMLYKIFIAQWRNPLRNDWTNLVKDDLKDFGLDIDLNSVTSMSKYKFKKIIKSKSREVAFEKLLERKEKHSKMGHLAYGELCMQNYLKSKNISVGQAQLLFKSRTRMTFYWENYKHGKMEQKCPLCKDQIDTQTHSFNCNIVIDNIQINGKFKDIFRNNIDSQIAETIENIENFRENYLLDR